MIDGASRAPPVGFLDDPGGRLAEVAETSLPLDLEPDEEEEEEERHQRIVDHVAERLVEINRTELEEQVGIPELLVTLAEREIRLEQRDCGRPEQCEPG